MDQVELIQSKVDIVDLINSYVPLKKAGRNFRALCPFHSEKTPSFIVSPERQIFKCFSCGEGGNVYHFLMKYENMEFGEALRFLADKTGIKLKSFRPSKAYQEREKLISLNHLASEFYHYILLKHKVGQQGLNYLLGRGISKDSIKTFKLGYAPQSWENLQDFLVKKKGFKRPDLFKAGLVVSGQRSFYDRFRGRIIFPLYDHRGNTLGFAGRVLEKDLKGAKYINTPETPIYHKSDLFYGLNITKKAIKEKDKAVIVEGELDLISSYQAGVKNVVAIKGTALTESQVTLIKRFTPNIALALDEDKAGDQASRRGIEMADKEGLNIRMIELSFGKDPDEAARHSPKLWRQSIKKAIPIYDFYLKSALKRFGKKGGESKKKVSEEMVPVISKITNQVVQAHYLKKLALSLNVSEEAVLREIERYEKNEKIKDDLRPTKPRKEEPKDKTRREKLEELLLGLIVQKKKGIKKYLLKVKIEILKGNAIKRIFEALNKYFIKERKDFKVNDFTKVLPEELLETLDQAFLKDLEIDLSDKEKYKLDFAKVLKELRKIYFKEELNILVSKMKKAETNNQGKKLQKLKEKFTSISQDLRNLV
ncbi:DNA primase [Candidatus Beckwithbacteria bacterium CG10_big_fil_rev_8_21_14_0_10_34_10]|uniref:DNA primase n=1 Tax=Candidatus Beckwithbacteria bacterium CG10_big_fil_rev_8_21_14_0_10_34_10 TaxID=1974495 RepID=A0A2H0WCA8_9BACT|nr:MAG: DNA primase [Candidatus Beckwithbacteria bacterium CG10_big_fil_rev_8_21_14_0_10_34_10]